MKKLLELFILFLTGGVIYFCAEMLIRGRSHWSMFICGGICFLAIGGINENLDYDIPLVEQMIYGALAITAVEFVFGCIFNLWLGLGIWDYSNLPGNVLGQICPQFTALWFLVSGVGIGLDDAIRWNLFGEEKRDYQIFWGRRK